MILSSKSNILQAYINGMPIIIHIIGWCLFTHFIFDLNDVYDSVRVLFEDGETIYFDPVFLILPIVIVFFYFNLLFLAPKLLNKQYGIAYVVSVFSCLIVMVIFVLSINQALKAIGYNTYETQEDLYINLVVMIVIMWGTSSSIVLYDKSINDARLKAAAEHQKLLAELQFLKAQVEPHFLFNTLNAIYSVAIDEDADKTADSVLKLSQMMRYVTKGASIDRVTLKMEIEFLQNYISLQQLRLSDNIIVDFEVKGVLYQHQIAPLLFVVFVENAFKYGVSYQQSSFIKILLTISPKGLTFVIENRIHNNDKTISSTQTGLANVQKRLAYLYPDKHQLTVNEDNAIYHLELVLDF